MKINKYIFILFISVLLIHQGCKKDYPKDIPDWLETLIKERKKECKKESCGCTQQGLGCWSVFEYDYLNEKHYALSYDIYLGNAHVIYDSQGVILCEDQVSTLPPPVTDCQYFYNSATKIRYIWIQTMN